MCLWDKGSLTTWDRNVTVGEVRVHKSIFLSGMTSDPFLYKSLSSFSLV